MDPLVIQILAGSAGSAALLPDASVTYAAQTSSTTAGSSFSFSSVAFSSTASDRLIVVSVGATAANQRTVSRVTIGGVSATGYENANRLRHGSLWVAAVPSGTTGTVDVNFSGSVDNCHIGVWALYGISSAVPRESNQVSGSYTNNSSTLNTAKGGVSIAAAVSAGAVTITWTGLTENFDLQVSSEMRSGASLVETVSDAAKAVSWTQSSSTNTTVTLATWR